MKAVIVDEAAGNMRTGCGEQRRSNTHRLAGSLLGKAGLLGRVGLGKELLLVLLVRLDLRKVHHTVRVLVHSVHLEGEGREGVWRKRVRRRCSSKKS